MDKDFLKHAVEEDNRSRKKAKRITLLLCLVVLVCLFGFLATRPNAEINTVSASHPDDTLEHTTQSQAPSEEAEAPSIQSSSAAPNSSQYSTGTTNQQLLAEMKAQSAKERQVWISKALLVSSNTAKIFDLLSFNQNDSQSTRGINYEKAKRLDNEVFSMTISLKLPAGGTSQQEQAMQLAAANTAHRASSIASELLWDTNSQHMDGLFWSVSPEYSLDKSKFLGLNTTFHQQISAIQALP